MRPGSRTLAAVALIASLAGCGGSASPATVTSTSRTSSSSSTGASISAGDTAACRTYGRVAPKVTSLLGNLDTLPAAVTARNFGAYADDLEAGTAAATNAGLSAAIAGTVTGLRSAAATAHGWTGGTLDLSADLTVVAEESTEVTRLCMAIDAGPYMAIVPD